MLIKVGKVAKMMGKVGSASFSKSNCGVAAKQLRVACNVYGGEVRVRKISRRPVFRALLGLQRFVVK